MKKLNLIKNWGYSFDETDDSDGYLSLGLIDKSKGTATSKLTDNEDLQHFNYPAFHKCRETFGKVFTDKTRSILYSHGGSQRANIVEFFSKIEDAIGISLKEKSQFFETQRTTVTPIRPAKFWLVCPLRRQIFTLLLRSGRNHILGNNYEIALQNSKYTKETFNILQLFISGYNQFHNSCLEKLAGDHHNGFFAQFHDLQIENVKNILLFKNE